MNLHAKSNSFDRCQLVTALWAFRRGEFSIRLAEEVADGLDLLLSDYAMPHLSGTEIVKAVRRLRPGLPALLMTGYADADDLNGRPSDVMVLGKPFTLPDLARAVRSAACPVD